MTNFITMVNRIATELRRSNMTDAIKASINDAIAEAAETRFFFNEQRGVTFNTVPGQEYYDDQNLVEIDTMYYMRGSARENVFLESNAEADIYATGTISQGQLDVYSRQGKSLRLYPIPNNIVAVFMDGYGRLTPYPLVGDTDTNAWFVEGERYIRALAKTILLRDVIRDMGEASVYNAIAEDYKATLLSETARRLGTGILKATCF